MRKFAMFVNKSLKTNMLKIKNLVKVERVVIMQANVEVLDIVYII